MTFAIGTAVEATNSITNESIRGIVTDNASINPTYAGGGWYVVVAESGQDFQVLASVTVEASKPFATADAKDSGYSPEYGGEW
jgi:hypothetical protein